MKILVIDDDPTNIEAALAQLKDHDVSVAYEYSTGENLLRQGKQQYDAVLVDLLMPADPWNFRPDHPLVGEMMPIGVFLAIFAAVQGTKHVALFTDSDHHTHPASACIDCLNPVREGSPSPFRINDSKVIMTNSRYWICRYRHDDLAHPLYDEEERPDDIRTKDWVGLLEYLLSDFVPGRQVQ